MRVIAIILSVFVLKLSIVPCCLDNAGKTVSTTVEVKSDCCSEPPSAHDEGSDQGGNKSCSPFFGCCSGAGFVSAKPMIVVEEAPYVALEPTFLYQNHYSFMWLDNIFQPPQTIA